MNQKNEQTKMDDNKKETSSSIEPKLMETEIAGLKLSIRSTHDKQTVEKLSELVNGKLKEITDGHPEISFQNALILGALNLAEDYLLLKKKAHDDISSIEAKAKILFDIEKSEEKITQVTI